VLLFQTSPANNIVNTWSTTESAAGGGEEGIPWWIILLMCIGFLLLLLLIALLILLLCGLWSVAVSRMHCLTMFSHHHASTLSSIN